jgi:hypothetical protein
MTKDIITGGVILIVAILLVWAGGQIHAHNCKESKEIAVKLAVKEALEGNHMTEKDYNVIDILKQFSREDRAHIKNIECYVTMDNYKEGE